MTQTNLTATAPAQPAQAPTKSTSSQLNELINGALKSQFQASLGKNTGAFLTSLVELCGSDKYLNQCQPVEIAKEALKAASMKLPISKALGFAYIVAYYNSKERRYQPALIPSYRGLIQLALRTGQYKTINCGEVYEGEYQNGNRMTGEFTIDGQRTSDKVIGYFAYFELLNGFRKMLYMTVEEMAQYAKNNSSALADRKDWRTGQTITVNVEQLIEQANIKKTSKGLGWTGDFSAMAQKTVLRRILTKYGVMSIEMMDAEESTVKAEAPEAADLTNEVIDITEQDEVRAAQIGATAQQPAQIEATAQTSATNVLNQADGKMLQRVEESATTQEKAPFA